ncbi:alpha beta hydrolase fold protein [Lentinula edodes]|uniref:Alpha beta hydrolase fold protein n=1 Tax=Lentinula edodes TaxID=5353 RepID=A0A1Q3EN68_LENED|nr:alpha beta hydrolase fold protein [Lentinula edodes]
MPSIEISSPTGKIKFHYTISTPSCADADKIDPEIPVLLFFHALAFHTVFHSQFSDPLLRKFNLVTFDLRWHGDTECDGVPEKYGQEEAAEDIIALITTLRLPPCHFVALDLGTMIALQIAVILPHQVLSLFIMSHVCLEELMNSLQEAGVDVTMEIVANAPHYLCLDYANDVNIMIYELVTHSMTKESIPPTPTNVISPWDAILREYGWKPDRVNELDDDDLTVSFPTWVDNK